MQHFLHRYAKHYGGGLVVTGFGPLLRTMRRHNFAKFRLLWARASSWLVAIAAIQATAEAGTKS